jgi:hypothetical protein
MPISVVVEDATRGGPATTGPRRKRRRRSTYPAAVRAVAGFGLGADALPATSTGVPLFASLGGSAALVFALIIYGAYRFLQNSEQGDLDRFGGGSHLAGLGAYRPRRRRRSGGHHRRRRR